MREERYTLAQLAEMTMLTERTLRNYIREGRLQGEMTLRGWRFTREEATALMANQAAARAMAANRNAFVEDFLHHREDTAGQSCMMLDIPAEDAESLSNRVLACVAHTGVNMSFSCQKGLARVTLKGPTPAVLAVLKCLEAEKTL